MGTAGGAWRGGAGRATATIRCRGARRSATNGGTSSIAYSYSDAGDLLTLGNALGGGAGVNYTATYTPAHQLASQGADNGAYVWNAPATSSDSYATVNVLNQYPSVNGAALGWDGNGNLTAIGGQSLRHDPEKPAGPGGAVRLLAGLQLRPAGPAQRRRPHQRPCRAPVGHRHLGAPSPGRRRPSPAPSSCMTAIPRSRSMTTRQPDRRFVPGAAIDEPIAMVTPAGGRQLLPHRPPGLGDRHGGHGRNRVEGPYTYDAYGNCFVGASTTSCNTLASTTEPYRYTGQRYDTDTGLYYYRARYYHPGLGRFAETDPVGYGPDINWYSYVGNDPTNRADPSGNCVEDACVVEGVGAGTILSMRVRLRPLEHVHSPIVSRRHMTTLVTSLITFCITNRRSHRHKRRALAPANPHAKGQARSQGRKQSKAWGNANLRELRHRDHSRPAGAEGRNATRNTD